MPAETTTPTAPPILEMQGVTVPAMEGRDRAVVTGVTWSVRAGDYWAVAGRHGSGKTDLLAVAAGLSQPSQGTIRVFGRDITGAEAEDWLMERLRIAYVFGEGGRVFGQMTVGQNLSLPLCYHHDCDEADVADEVERILGAVGLSEFRDQFPARLSHVWRQRIGLARALALKPDLLLLDNPLAGLDATETAWWFDFIGKLAEGHPVIGGKRLTLVVTASGLRPWLGRATHFAMLHEKQWHLIGGRSELESTDNPLFDDALN